MMRHYRASSVQLAAIALMCACLAMCAHPAHATRTSKVGQSCEFDLDAPLYVTVREEPGWVGEASLTNTPRFLTGSRPTNIKHTERFGAHYNFADNLCCIKRGDGVLKPFKQRLEQTQNHAKSRPATSEFVCTGLQVTKLELLVNMPSDSKPPVHVLRVSERGSKTMENVKQCAFDRDAMYFVTVVQPPADSVAARGVAADELPVYMFVTDRSDGAGELHPDELKAARPEFFDNLCCVVPKAGGKVVNPIPGAHKVPVRVCSVAPPPTSMLDFIASLPVAEQAKPQQQQGPAAVVVAKPTEAPKPPPPTEPQREFVKTLKTYYEFQNIRRWEGPPCTATGQMLVFKYPNGGWESLLQVRSVKSGTVKDGTLFGGEISQENEMRYKYKPYVDYKKFGVDKNRYCCETVENGHVLQCVDTKKPNAPDVKDPTKQFAEDLHNAMAEANRVLRK